MKTIEKLTDTEGLQKGEAVKIWDEEYIFEGLGEGWIKGRTSIIVVHEGNGIFGFSRERLEYQTNEQGNVSGSYSWKLLSGKVKDYCDALDNFSSIIRQATERILETRR